MRVSGIVFLSCSQNCGADLLALIIRPRDAVRHALHCRAGKIVAQGHPFAVPAMARYIFFSGRTSSSGDFRPLRRVFAFCASSCRSLQKVQSPRGLARGLMLRMPEKYVVQHIKTCCTTYKYSCKLRKKAVPLH